VRVDGIVLDRATDRPAVTPDYPSFDPNDDMIYTLRWE